MVKLVPEPGGDRHGEERRRREQAETDAGHEAVAGPRSGSPMPLANQVASTARTAWMP